METEVVSDQGAEGTELIARADGADTEATLAALGFSGLLFAEREAIDDYLQAFA